MTALVSQKIDVSERPSAFYSNCVFVCGECIYWKVIYTARVHIPLWTSDIDTAILAMNRLLAITDSAMLLEHFLNNHTTLSKALLHLYVTIKSFNLYSQMSSLNLKKKNYNNLSCY